MKGVEILMRRWPFKSTFWWTVLTLAAAFTLLTLTSAGACGSITHPCR